MSQIETLSEFLFIIETDIADNSIQFNRYCRRNARFPMHCSPHRKFQKCTAHVLICPDETYKALVDTLSDNNRAFEKENVVNIVLASYHSVTLLCRAVRLSICCFCYLNLSNKQTTLPANWRFRGHSLCFKGHCLIKSQIHY